MIASRSLLFSDAPAMVELSKFNLVAGGINTSPFRWSKEWGILASLAGYAKAGWQGCHPLGKQGCLPLRPARVTYSQCLDIPRGRTGNAMPAQPNHSPIDNFN